MGTADIGYLIEVAARAIGFILVGLAFIWQNKELKVLQAEVQNLTKLLCSIISGLNLKK